VPDDKEIVCAGLGVDSVPAPLTARPTVSAATALSAAGKLGFQATGQAADQPSVALRLVTTGDFADASRTAMSVKNRLAWVLTYHDSKAIYYGGTGPSTSPNCDFIIVIDAKTAATMANFQVCPPPANS
jgi:hypothetical protein